MACGEIKDFLLNCLKSADKLKVQWKSASGEFEWNRQNNSLTDIRAASILGQKANRDVTLSYNSPSMSTPSENTSYPQAESPASNPRQRENPVSQSTSGSEGQAGSSVGHLGLEAASEAEISVSGLRGALCHQVCSNVVFALGF